MIKKIKQIENEYLKYLEKLIKLAMEQSGAKLSEKKVDLFRKAILEFGYNSKEFYRKAIIDLLEELAGEERKHSPCDCCTNPNCMRDKRCIGCAVSKALNEKRQSILDLLKQLKP